LLVLVVNILVVNRYWSFHLTKREEREVVFFPLALARLDEETFERWDARQHGLRNRLNMRSS
jgi:hypothetical protein